MRITSSQKKTIKVCGVKIHPTKKGEPLNYKKLSLKDPKHRFQLLAMRDANMIDFDSEEKIDYDKVESLPFFDKEKEKKRAAKKPQLQKKKAAATNVRDNEKTIGRTESDGNSDSGNGSISGQKRNKGK